MNSHPKDERLYLALEQVLEEMSQSTRPQQKLTDELGTLLANHYEEYGNRGERLSDEIEVDIQFKHQDSPFDLTQKQEQAFQLCKKLTSEKNREKRFLVEKILSKGIYSSSYQAKKTLKLLLRVDKIPLESRGNKVRNTAD
mgnify:CR=1 FL=1